LLAGTKEWRAASCGLPRPALMAQDLCKYLDPETWTRSLTGTGIVGADVEYVNTCEKAVGLVPTNG
jgi:hypothetical protein